MTQPTWDQAVIGAAWKLGQVGQGAGGTTTVGLLGTPLHPGLGPVPQRPAVLGHPFPPSPSPQHPLTQYSKRRWTPYPVRWVSSDTRASPCWFCPLAPCQLWPPSNPSPCQQKGRPPASTPHSLPVPVPPMCPSVHPPPHLQAALPCCPRGDLGAGSPQGFPWTPQHSECRAIRQQAVSKGPHHHG